MARIEVKQWIYIDAQAKAGQYNRTLVWDKGHIEDEAFSGWHKKDTFFLYGEPVRETEKAVQYNLKYWNLSKAFRGGQLVGTDAESGWMCWIPKSAIVSK